MKKNYSILVEGEEVPFDWVEVDQNGNPINAEEWQRQNMLENANKFMLITHLPYTPEVGSQWDNRGDFRFKGKWGAQPRNVSHDNPRIAFVKDMVYLGEIEFNQSDKAQMLVAALLSNPQIIAGTITE
jgi:hypothetical protein